MKFKYLVLSLELIGCYSNPQTTTPVKEEKNNPSVVYFVIQNPVTQKAETENKDSNTTVKVEINNHVTPLSVEEKNEFK
jgi:hypothetical protein